MKNIQYKRKFTGTVGNHSNLSLQPPHRTVIYSMVASNQNPDGLSWFSIREDNGQIYPRNYLYEDGSDRMTYEVRFWAYLLSVNPVVLRTDKTLWSFGSSECNRVNLLKSNSYC